MKERPILFSGAMVQAILDGRKSQTRRVMKPQPSEGWTPYSYGEVHKLVCGEPDPDKVMGWGPSDADGHEAYACPYGQPGDQFFVRENGWQRPKRTYHMIREGADTWPSYLYDADSLTESDVEDCKRCGWKRRPSIHMPRWASRITLEIVNVRVERLQSISEADAIAEGIEGFYINGRREAWQNYSGFGGDACDSALGDPRESYRTLWDSINAARGHGWEKNEFVWCIEFRRINQKEAL